MEKTASAARIARASTATKSRQTPPHDCMHTRDVAAAVTAIVKTFERPRSLDRLVRSVRRRYPQLRVIVGDDSLVAYPRRDVEYVRLPVDVGVAAGRNALLDMVRTPYFVSLDDDFAFTDETRLELLLETIQRHDAALVAGDLVACKQKFAWRVERRRELYQGVIRREGDALRLIRGHAGSVGDAYQCDVTPHFFLARTDAIRQIGGWFAPLKAEDHHELLIRLKDAGLRVLHRPDVAAEHWQELPLAYAAYRARDYAPLVARRHGLRSIIDMDGREREFPELRAA
jgi:(N-acetylneuraminyl)-galactosylglucosylceramide N-acetylgalactosaminyltransferase